LSWPVVAGAVSPAGSGGETLSGAESSGGWRVGRPAPALDAGDDEDGAVSEDAASASCGLESNGCVARTAAVAIAATAREAAEADDSGRRRRAERSPESARPARSTG
jgi:hypothetical protein